jgi:large subunit ribosomal protein L32
MFDHCESLQIDLYCVYMSVRMRHTPSHTRNRRSHHALSTVRLSTCGKCKSKHVRHTLCENCGTYRGREYKDILAKLNKKERKAKEKDLAMQKETPDANAVLDPEKLSNK